MEENLSSHPDETPVNNQITDDLTSTLSESEPQADAGSRLDNGEQGSDAVETTGETKPTAEAAGDGAAKPEGRPEAPPKPNDGFDHLRDKQRKRESIMARVIKWQKNGLEMELEEGTRAFMPNDMIDRDPNRNIANYFGKTVPVKITSVKVVAKKPDIIVSHRAVIEEELREQGKEKIQSLNLGDIVEAKVKGFNSQGAVIDLGPGVDAIIRTQHLTWDPIEHPYEAVKRGDDVKAKILLIDKGRRRVQLGIRQLTSDPFIAKFSKYTQGDTVKGTVTQTNDFGAELSLEEGIVAFLPISEVSWSRIPSVDSVLKKGDEVDVKILTTDKENRRITVSSKQLVENPLRLLENTYKVGTDHDGVIKEVNRGGVVVQLEHGAEGFIPRRELSHDRLERMEDHFKAGKALQALRVIEYDRRNGKITMSLIEGERQAEKNSLRNYKSNSSASSFTLGDLASLKEKLEKLERGS